MYGILVVNSIDDAEFLTSSNFSVLFELSLSGGNHSPSTTNKSLSFDSSHQKGILLFLFLLVLSNDVLYPARRHHGRCTILWRASLEEYESTLGCR